MSDEEGSLPDLPQDVEDAIDGAIVDIALAEDEERVARQLEQRDTRMGEMAAAGGALGDFATSAYFAAQGVPVGVDWLERRPAPITGALGQGMHTVEAREEYMMQLRVHGWNLTAPDGDHFMLDGLVVQHALQAAAEHAAVATESTDAVEEGPFFVVRLHPTATHPLYGNTVDEFVVIVEDAFPYSYADDVIHGRVRQSLYSQGVFAMSWLLSRGARDEGLRRILEWWHDQMENATAPPGEVFIALEATLNMALTGLAGHHSIFTRKAEVSSVERMGLPASTTEHAFVTARTHLTELWVRMLTVLLAASSEKDFGKSGYRVMSVQNLVIRLMPVPQIAVGRWIQLPAAIEKKRCCVNITNYDDDLCSRYAFTLGVLLARDPHMDIQRKHHEVRFYQDKWKEFNWKGIQAPMEIREWDKFERQNPGYSVFVYEATLSEDQSRVTGVTVLHLPTKRTPGNIPIYLLYLEKELETGEHRQHYVTIHSLSRLLNSCRKQGLVCPYCGCHVYEIAKYDSHVMQCSTITNTLCDMVEPGSVQEFNRFEAQFYQDVFFVADFETRMEVDPTDPNVKLHKPLSFALHVYNRLEGKDTRNKLECDSVLFSHPDPQVVVQTLLDNLKACSDAARRFLAPCAENMHPAFVTAAGWTQPCTEPYTTPCLACGAMVGDMPSVAMKSVIMQEEAKRLKQQAFKRRKQRERRAAEVEDEAMEGEDEDDGESSEPEHSSSSDDEGGSAPVVESHVTSATTGGFGAWVNYLTGEMEGYVHHACSPVLREKQRRSAARPVQCYFHNGTGYDVKLILQYLGDCEVEGVETAFCIAQSSERFKRIDICGVSIVDSMGHLASGLESLVAQVTNKGRNPERCETIMAGVDRELRRIGLSDQSGELKRMLTRKGVFPYAYLDSWEKMNDTRLPPREAFKSDLTGRDISEEDYAFAQTVWNAFGCETLKDYHDWYLRVDVWGLTDVLKRYGEFGMKHYGLDFTRYASAPAAAYDAMLKMTKSRIELISDMETHLAFEQAIRGGVSMACIPNAVAENKYTRMEAEGATEPGEEKEGDTFIATIDANNLYGGKMSMPLPTGNFCWLLPAEVAAFDCQARLSEVPGPKGFLLDVDLAIPDELHDYFNDLPPAPERIKPTVDVLSDWQARELAQSSRVRTCKLIPHLGVRKNYMVNGCTLATYVRLGVVVTKVNRVLSFDQSAFMRPFVHKNTMLRKEGSRQNDTLLVALAKLMTNSVFGKTMMDVRRFGVFKLARTQMDAKQKDLLRRKIASNKVKRVECMGSLMVTEMNKKRVVLNQPVYLGATILDYAKQDLYHMWYDNLRAHFDCRLVYTDTDSLIFLMKTGDVYRDCAVMEIRKNGGPITEPGQGIFDWSSLDKNKHPDYYSTINDKELGMYKWDDGSDIISEIVALRSKMYMKRKVGGECKKVAKGVMRQCHEMLNFKECLDTSKVRDVSFATIAGRKFIVGTRTMTKAGLAGPETNDKMFITRGAGGAWEAWALGHWRTRASVEEAEALLLSLGEE
jgi:hypothetical protein